MAKYEAYNRVKKENPDRVVKGQPKAAPVVAKKRLTISKGTWIGIAVVVVIVALILVWTGSLHGWFPEKREMIGGEWTVENYDPLEIDKTKVEVTDEEINNTINQELTAHADSETLTEGTVEDGDVVNIDYAGTLADTGVAFEGGTAKGQDLEIGSGRFIEGFESGLIGKEIGSELDLNLTFPENYDNEELKGRAVIFHVKINSATRTHKPELNDAWAKEYAKEHITDAETPIETLEDLKTYYRNSMYDSKLESAIVNAMADKVTVTSYDEAVKTMVGTYMEQLINSQATSYGMEVDQLAKMFGAEDSKTYIEQETETTLKMIMWIDQVLKDNNISWTGVQFDKALQKYLDSNPSEKAKSVQELKEQAGTTWLYMYKNTDFKYHLAVDALKQKVKLVEAEADAGQENESQAETESK